MTCAPVFKTKENRNSPPPLLLLFLEAGASGRLADDTKKCMHSILLNKMKPTLNKKTQPLAIKFNNHKRNCFCLHKQRTLACLFLLLVASLFGCVLAVWCAPPILLR